MPAPLVKIDLEFPYPREQIDVAELALRRRALQQPDRRLGHDPVRGSRPPGAGQGRRAPDRGRADRPRARVRCDGAILRHGGAVGVAVALVAKRGAESTSEAGDEAKPCPEGGTT